MDEEYQKARLLRAVGNDPRVDAELDAIWGRFPTMTDLEMRFNYALLDAFQLLMGSTYKLYDLTTSVGEKLMLNQVFKNLLEMCRAAQAAVDKEVDVLPASRGANGSPLVSEMEATHPMMTPEGMYPDPNSTRYQGDPLWWYRGQR